MSNAERSAAILDLLQSDRVSANTRTALLDRAAAPAPDRVLAPGDIATLRCVVDRLLPAAGLDLADRIDAGLTSGDGWRHATLPSDIEAYRLGLAALDQHALIRCGRPFALLSAREQDDALRQAEAGQIDSANTMSAEQVALWFADVRSDATRAYVSHPATLARIGYTGFAYGGDGPVKPGFVHLGLGDAEPWEPS